MGLEKLIITAFSKPDYEGSGVKTFTVLINPESYKKDISISYASKQPLGSATPEQRFTNIGTETVSFKLIFDGTGLVSTAPSSLKNGKTIKSVDEQIELFQEVTTVYQGDIHRPYFLQLTWGNLLFEGVLTSLNINYKLFKSDGTPLRAEADATFSSSVPTGKQQRRKRKKSPDVTHVVKVKAGDRLPLLSNEIYDKENYFVQVAEKNQLNNLRKLKFGTNLLFPPVLNK